MAEMIETQIIDGKALAALVREQVRESVAKLDFVPTLAVVLVGEDPASQVYVRNKIRLTEQVGMRSIHHRLPASSSQSEVEALVQSLNRDDAVDGILVQLPLPKGLDENGVIALIDPDKDVDGLTISNIGRLTAGIEGLRPCTPRGCLYLAKAALGDDLSGLNVLVIGRSILVGKPVAALFLEQNCTVTIAHSRTTNLPQLCARADIVIAAVGRPEMVKGEWLKPGATVIDVGINRLEFENSAGKLESKLVGDVDFASCKGRAAQVTPVPGGVGPTTIAFLLQNTLDASIRRRTLHRA